MKPGQAWAPCRKGRLLPASEVVCRQGFFGTGLVKYDGLKRLQRSGGGLNPHTFRPIVAPRPPASTTAAIASNAARKIFAFGPPAAITGTGELSTIWRNEATSPV